MAQSYMVKSTFPAFFSQGDAYPCARRERVQRSISTLILRPDIVHGMTTVSFDLNDVPHIAV